MPSLRLVGINLLYSMNLGYIARVMKNFGVYDLYLVKVKREIIEDSLKYCAHACDIINKAKIVDNIEDALKSVELVAGTTAIQAESRNNLLRQCITPRDFAKTYFKRENPVAVIFGRESTGLTNEELNLCDIIVNIPANSTYHTLNVSHTAAIILYEIFLQSNSKCVKEGIRREEIYRTCKIFSDLCEATKMPSHKSRIAKLAFKNILFRAAPNRREISILNSPLRRAIRSLKNDKMG